MGKFFRGHLEFTTRLFYLGSVRVGGLDLSLSGYSPALDEDFQIHDRRRYIINFMCVDTGMLSTPCTGETMLLSSV